jgi:hypothetical protein
LEDFIAVEGHSQATVLAEHGHALCRLHRDNAGGPDFRRGRTVGPIPNLMYFSALRAIFSAKLANPLALLEEADEQFGASVRKLDAYKPPCRFGRWMWS